MGNGTQPRPLRRLADWLRERDWLFVGYVVALTMAFSGAGAVIVHVARAMEKCR